MSLLSSKTGVFVLYIFGHLHRANISSIDSVFMRFIPFFSFFFSLNVLVSQHWSVLYVHLCMYVCMCLLFVIFEGSYALLYIKCNCFRSDSCPSQLSSYNASPLDNSTAVTANNSSTNNGNTTIILAANNAGNVAVRHHTTNTYGCSPNSSPAVAAISSQQQWITRQKYLSHEQPDSRRYVVLPTRRTQTYINRVQIPYLR